jgi:hypothetical protein
LKRFKPHSPTSVQYIRRLTTAGTDGRQNAGLGARGVKSRVAMATGSCCLVTRRYQFNEIQRNTLIGTRHRADVSIRKNVCSFAEGWKNYPNKKASMANMNGVKRRVLVVVSESI